MEKTESKVKTALETITEVGLKFYGNRYYSVEFTTLHVVKLMESYAAQQVTLAIAEKDKEIAEAELKYQNTVEDRYKFVKQAEQILNLRDAEIERLKEGLREILKQRDYYSIITIVKNLLKPLTGKIIEQIPLLPGDKITDKRDPEGTVWRIKARIEVNFVNELHLEDVSDRTNCRVIPTYENLKYLEVVAYSI